MGKRMWLVAIAGAAVAVLCCGGLGLVFVLPVAQRSLDRSQRQNELRKIGNALYDFNEAKSRPAASVDELESGGFLTDATVLEKVKSGRYFVVWSALLTEEEQPDGRSKCILAYDTQQDADGSWVVMLGDTLAKTIGDDEFNATPKLRQARK
jgi:hypothetical protein